MARSFIPRSMSDPRFGFRLSMMDVAVIALASVGFGNLWSKETPFAWIVPCVVIHFFLFCNVFRLRSKLELSWAMIFVVNVLAHACAGSASLWPCLGWQLPVSVAVIVLQLRSPWYHGIAARRINPRLDDYLNSKL